MAKKVALIGGSGFVGSVILKELLARGWNVETLARNPDKITIKNPGLTVKKCDVSDEKALAADLKGYAEVISAYNPGWSNPNIYEDTLKNYPIIVAACKEAGVKRVLIVGGAGTLFVKPGVRLMDTGALPEEWLPGVKSLGKFHLENLRKEDGIDWVFISPAAELEPESKDSKPYNVGGDDLIVDSNGKSNIRVSDYAKALVDELENPLHHMTRITVGYYV